MKIPTADIEIVNPSANVDEETLQNLTDSIREQGLSHPVIVRPANTLGKYILASGEKRLLAFRRLEWLEIEADVRKIDERKGKEIRLHENLKRFNLPWYEQVVLVKELHDLRQEEHGQAALGRPVKEAPKGWSIRDTAEELGVGIGPLSEDLGLARALEKDPSLAKVSDKKTAIRIMRIRINQYEAEEHAALPVSGERAGLVDQVFFGDSADVLKQLPSSSIDHCITDPPWIKYFDPRLTIDKRTLPVFRELYRVLKANAMLYIFAGHDDVVYYSGYDTVDPIDPSRTLHIKGELDKIGYSVSSTPIMWQKLKSLSRRGMRAWEYARDFEFIIVAAKGSPTLTSIGQLSSVKSFDIVPPVSMVHPNEKPVALIQDLLADCSYEGNIILDPFGGSGVLGAACKGTGRHFVVIERERDVYEKICKRLGF